MRTIPFKHPLATHAAGTVLGYRRGGSPIYAIAGGNGEGEGGSGSGSGEGGAGAGEGGAGAGQGSGQQGGQSGGQNGGNQGAGHGGSGDNSQDVKSLPDWAQKALTDARAEAGKARTTAKENAAKEAREQLLQEFGKQLGFIKDDDKPDPAALAAAIGEKDTRIGSLEGTVRDLTVELAAYKAAGKHNASPAALLDSRSFLESVKGLDPADKDFGTKLDAAIKAAVEGNAQLRTGQAPQRGGGEFNGAPGAAGRPTSLGQAVAAGLGG
ncbi:hypothetical protein [Streptomyces sp.]|uniref:hypothetical protein n=1 Tax=Streptomyces sp. TaxID=1931 RepID=UPI002D76801E|nr:hypothetical protein [Streptomyces sp.]HET6353392.1 hypothetical protein [Streptomyces sp.]